MSTTPTPPEKTPRLRLWATLAAVSTVIVIVLVIVFAAPSSSPSSGSVPPIQARRGPETMFTAGSTATDTPTTLDMLKALGVDRVHVYMHWADVAPDPTSATKPAFDAGNPSAYPAAGWVQYDTVVKALAARHMGIMLDLVAPPPNWAAGKGAPHPKSQPEWRPSAADFGQFVRAVATRYSGHYTPPGAPKPLPRVNFWSIWNEPNLGIEMAPEAIDHSQVEVSAHYYRDFVDAAWKAYHATGHGNDTILFGEIAPAGSFTGVGPGDFNSMPPLRYLRAMYCVDSNFKPLRGQAAIIRDCPPDAAGSAHFAANHPGLFHASGFADHPYPQGLAPNVVTPNEPDFAELGEIGKLESTLDRLQQVYGSHTKFPIWSTEFGYQTTPPDPEAGTVTPDKAAYYLNWAEYLTWADPRLRSFDQYLLTDPPNGYFATGLLTAAGAPKPGFYAFQMPLYLPVTNASASQALDVWGGVRPAKVVKAHTHRTQFVEIQFRAGSSGPWRTVKRLAITDEFGYFDVKQRFDSSGQVRLSWTPPHAAPTFSRTVDITLH
ncbi:MAG: hypothetical protein WBQ18_14385 [Solirubrobacteraceae bacterium]